MKRVTKITAALAALTLIVAGSVFAQETTSGDTTTDDSGFGSFATDTTNSTATTSAITFNGSALLDIRSYVDKTDLDTFTDLEDFPIDATPSFKLTADYSGASSEITAKLKFSQDVIENHPEDIINELTARAFLGNFVVEAGKMKLVWGKGDKVHVVDNFNANDYTDFVIPDYIDRRLAEPMLHVVWNGPSTIRAEAVYTPMMTPDRFATSGNWTPSSYSDLQTSLETEAGTDVATALATSETTAAAYSYYLITKGATDTSTLTAQVSMASAAKAYTLALNNATTLADNLYPDTYKLKYGQAGFRVTGTAGPIDLGASYYYGHYKEPTVNYSKMSSYVEKYLAGTTTEDNKFLSYDQLQVFGFEAAGVAGPLNLRGEFAYNLTNDTTGDDPWVHNNSIAWVAGFDVDLPISNLNVNIQETGKYILNNDKIGTGDYAAYKTYDADYNSDGTYTSDQIVVDVSDSYFNENVKADFAVIYGIEYQELMLMPKITWNIKDGMDIIGSGLWITSDNKNGTFYDYRKNSFVQLGVKYQF